MKVYIDGFLRFKIDERMSTETETNIVIPCPLCRREGRQEPKVKIYQPKRKWTEREIQQFIRDFLSKHPHPDH